MKELKGHVIRELTLSEDGLTLTVLTDTKQFLYRTEGDCCAHAYLLSPDKQDIQAIIGHRVIEVRSSGVKSEGDELGDNWIDTEFYSIKTQFADLDLELRTEHNGYYCGWVYLAAKIDR